MGALMLATVVGDEYAERLGAALQTQGVVRVLGLLSTPNTDTHTANLLELSPAATQTDLLIVALGAHDTALDDYPEQMTTLAARLQGAISPKACVWIGPLEDSAASKARRRAVGQAQRRARLPSGWGWVDGYELSAGLVSPLTPWGYSKVAERLVRHLGVARPIDTLASSFLRAVTFGVAD